VLDREGDSAGPGFALAVLLCGTWIASSFVRSVFSARTFMAEFKHQHGNEERCETTRIDSRRPEAIARFTGQGRSHAEVRR
jgi:hypothetical protein